MDSQPTSAYKQVFELLGAFQRRNRSIVTVQETGLSMTEAHLLAALDADPELNAQDLAEVLNVDKSSLSRALTSLEEEKMISRNPDPKDGRKKLIKMLAPGKRAIETYDQSAQERLDAFGRNLTLAELSELRVLFERFADGSGAARVPAKSGKNPMIIAIRRVTRAFGVLGSRFVGQAITAATWQLLIQLKRGNEAQVTASEIAEALNLEPNTVSLMLTRLKKKKWVNSKADAQDRRRNLLRLSSQGLRELQAVEDAAEEKVKEDLVEFSEIDLARFIELFSKFVGKGKVDESPLRIAPGTVIRTPKASELPELRGFLLFNLVRRNRHQLVSESILSSGNKVYGLWRGGEVIGVCEFERRDSAAYLQNLAVHNDIEKTEIASKFLRLASRASVSEGVNQIVISDFDAEILAVDEGFQIDSGARISIEAS